ncbi:hypothetical protein MLD38_009302 [Melastoma candidum]|uniref:Uncharacterized protein n=1 Tax=Melastoma candidum TaxID=119954 RepID=A0ACB9RYJ0_9MYRT|nr:hypothetical protein MLD38_009302 [Melastoma candidum]
MVLVIENSIQKVVQAQNSDCQLDCRALVAELGSKIKEITSLSRLEGTQKELNIALSKYAKVLEKSFNADIANAYRHVDMDASTVNQIIACHFYRQGVFEVGDCFVNEAMGPDSVNMIKSPYIEMYQIIEAMRNQNLVPALKWASSNSSRMKENGSDLELKLHRMQFVEILQRGSRDEALRYARTHLAPFASSHMAEIQKLMGCLLWAGRLEQSPYPDVLSLANWDKLAEEVARQFCSLLGQSYESPLSVTVSAGFQVLPQFLKYLTVSGKKEEWQTTKHLPVPVELDDELQFHSIFVCPVSKDQASDDNPPMLMKCGHVLCKQSIMRMSKNLSKSFKCPYCPSDIDANQYCSLPVKLRRSV